MTENFAYKEKVAEYNNKVASLEQEANFENLSTEEEWEKIVEICKQAGRDSRYSW